MPVKKARQAIPNNLLRRAREELGWSQEDVARRIETETQNVIRWETGVARPRPLAQQKLQALFGKSSKELGFLVQQPMLSLYDSQAPIYDIAIPEGFRDPLDFVGREQLLTELRQFVCNSQHVVLSALNGLPGVGKTTIAIELAHALEIRVHFTGGILWAGLGKQANIEGILSRWGKQLGISEAEMGKLGNYDAWAIAIHAAIGGRRMLVVIDDAWEIEHILACKLGGSACTYLITTRFSDIAAYFAGERAIHVEELGEDDAFLLLKRLAPVATRTDEESAKKLIHAVGGLPLTITLMGGYLSKQTRSKQRRRIQAALDYLQDTKKRLEIEEPQGGLKRHTSLPLEVPISLQAIISISYQTLAIEAQQALQALSVFPAKPNTFSEEAALAVSSLSTRPIDLLGDYGLLENGGLDRYMLHQTIADYARIHCSDPSIAERRLAEYFASFAKQHEADYKILEQEETNLQAALQIASRQEMHDILLQGVNAFYTFLERRGLYKRAEAYLIQAQRSAESLNDRTGLVTVLLNLGRTMDKAGDYKRAEGYLEEGLQVARESDHKESICSLLANLGGVAGKQGDFKRAETYLEEGLELARQSGYRKSMDHLLENLGALAGQRGDYKQAKAYLEEGLELARQFDHRAVICRLLENLGVAASQQGDYERAKGYLEEGLELARQLDHKENICGLLANLGDLTGQQGDYEKAKGYLEEGLELARQLDHKENICSLLANLGELTSQQGDYEKAEGYLEEGLELARQLDHKESICFLLQYLGKAAASRRNYQSAETYLREGLELARRIGHKELISVLLQHLGEVAISQRDYRQAETYLEEGLKIARQLGHRMILAGILCRRGNLYLKMSQLNIALDNFQEALDTAPEESRDIIAEAQFGVVQIEAEFGNYHKEKKTLRQ